MLEKYTRYHFFEWCMTQEPDKVICHSNWNTCALGDFARAMNPEMEVLELDPEPEQLNDIKYDRGYNCPVFETLLAKDNKLDNYDQLCEEIVEHYPDFATFLDG